VSGGFWAGYQLSVTRALVRVHALSAPVARLMPPPRPLAPAPRCMPRGRPSIRPAVQAPTPRRSESALPWFVLSTQRSLSLDHLLSRPPALADPLCTRHASGPQAHGDLWRAAQAECHLRRPAAGGLLRRPRVRRCARRPCSRAGRRSRSPLAHANNHTSDGRTALLGHTCRPAAHTGASVRTRANAHMHARLHMGVHAQRTRAPPGSADVRARPSYTTILGACPPQPQACGT
jgi:hypothetical protein